MPRSYSVKSAGNHQNKANTNTKCLESVKIAQLLSHQLGESLFLSPYKVIEIKKKRDFYVHRRVE